MRWLVKWLLKCSVTLEWNLLGNLERCKKVSRGGFGEGSSRTQREPSFLGVTVGKGQGVFSVALAYFSPSQRSSVDDSIPVANIIKMAGSWLLK